MRLLYGTVFMSTVSIARILIIEVIFVKFKVFVLSKLSGTVLLCTLIMSCIALCSILLFAEEEKDCLLPIYCVQTEEPVISVTFDCAWTADDIPYIIKTLDKYDCKATFFVVGTWAEEYPEAVKMLYEAGHEIAGHSYNHAHYNTLSCQELISDMEKCDAVINSVTGSVVPIFRAPYGEYNDTVVSAANASGRTLIQWDVDSLDWKSLTESEMMTRIMPKVQNGSILLFHNGTKYTAGALDGILNALSDKGFSFKPVTELLCNGSYTIDHTGKQIPA